MFFVISLLWAPVVVLKFWFYNFWLFCLKSMSLDKPFFPKLFTKFYLIYFYLLKDGKEFFKRDKSSYPWSVIELLRDSH